MKNFAVIGGKLALICAVAALVLALVNAVTEPVITLRKQQEFKAAISSIAGGARVGEQTVVQETSTVNSYFPVYGPKGEVSGYVVQLTGIGYGGDMNMLAGYEADGEVSNVVLMENQETPGLGKKAEDPAYMEKFIGTGGDEPVPVRKDQLGQSDADAVTGSTITFVGISKALEEGSTFVKTLGGDQ